jgi:hypothetical protein
MDRQLGQQRWDQLKRYVADGSGWVQRPDASLHEQILDTLVAQLIQNWKLVNLPPRWVAYDRCRKSLPVLPPGALSMAPLPHSGAMTYVRIWGTTEE